MCVDVCVETLRLIITTMENSWGFVGFIFSLITKKEIRISTKQQFSQ